MKLWFQTVFSAALFCVWATPPNALALPSANTAKQMAQEFGVVTSTSAKNSIVVELIDKNGAVITQLAAKLTPRTELAKYKPSEIMKMMDAPELKKKAGFSFLRMAKEKLFRLPTESLGFFISLGAIVTYDLIQNASYNPVGFEQLVESQLDPLGQLAFYAFMVSQGAASEPFMHMMQDGRLNPRFAPFIKYSGMSIGMLASNVVHEVGAFGTCAKRWIPNSGKKPQEMDNCDRAFAAWNDRGGLAGVTNEWKPGLLSLIASTLIAGVIESGFHKVRFLVSPITKTITGVVVTGGKWTLGKLIQIAGIELALLAVPGGVFIKGLRVVTSSAAWLGQMTLFNGVQHAIELQIADVYGNAVQGADFKKLDSKIVSNVLIAKKQNWNEQASFNLRNDLKELGKSMQKWRQLNMSRVLQSQANWEQKISQLSLMYRNSQLFYSDFVSRLWERKYGPFKDRYASGDSVSILDRNFPLNGVLVAKAAAEDDTTWLEAPDMIEQRQLYTIQLALQNFKAPALPKKEQDALNGLVLELKQSERVKVGQALDKMNCFLRLSKNGNCQYSSVSSNLFQALNELRKSIGKPEPIWNPGVGYLVAYSTTPANQKEMARAFYAKSWGPLSTMTLPESMMASMMFGPDLEKGESSLVSNNGFKDIFKAPRIRALDNFMPNLKSRPVSAALADIFNTDIYKYLNKGNIRNSVLNQNQESFDLWWKKYPETQYLMAWLDYERIYQGNIAYLVQALEVGDEKFFNYGPVSNGVLTAHTQEIKFYTMLLGEIMKDNLAAKNMTIPDDFFGNPIFPVPASKQNGGTEIFSYLRTNWNVGFAGYLQSLQTSASNDTSQLRNFVWQNEILERLEDMKKLIRKLQTRDIKVSAGETQKMPVSTLNQSELREKMQDLNTYLEELQKSGFSQDSMLNPQQAALVESTFKALKSNLAEMERLADIANAVSYVPRHEDNGFVKRQCLDTPKPAGMSGVSAVKRAVEGC